MDGFTRKSGCPSDLTLQRSSMGIRFHGKHVGGLKPAALKELILRLHDNKHAEFDTSPKTP